MNVLYSLQQLGYWATRSPPQADVGWVGEAGLVPCYLDDGSGERKNDLHPLQHDILTWNLMHLAAMLKRSGGFPAHGNQRSAWDAGARLDHPNPEYR